VVDNTGARAPLCSDVLANQNRDPASKAIADSTMFATASPTETKKRIPKADDLLGVTEAYPIAQDPKICEMPKFQDPCAKSSGGGGGMTESSMRPTCGSRVPAMGFASASVDLSAAAGGLGKYSSW